MAIDYLGRQDDQVKIRGMRVELGEIEAVLAAHPEISCCVTLRNDRAGNRQLVAYLVPRPDAHLTQENLRAFVRRQLPDHMVPAAFAFIAALPLTANGKLDKRALPEPKPSAVKAGTKPRTGLESTVAGVWQEILDADDIRIDEDFFDIGGHSLAVIEVQIRLEALLGNQISTADLFEFPTIRRLADHLLRFVPGEPGTTQPRQRPVARPGAGDEGIAIIGMAGRFPGARNVDELWLNLCAGKETIVDLSAEDVRAAGAGPELMDNPQHVRREGILQGFDEFDAAFFAISPKDATYMDPQQRLLLETSWQALEHAGYGARRDERGDVGVFVGVGTNRYPFDRIPPTDRAEGAAGYQLQLLTSKDFAATRVSHKLNLRGPAISVQTACSTSLVAIHLACRALKAGECTLALAGGASIAPTHGKGYVYQEGHIFSPDGHCRAFDMDAKGTVRGSGAGVVVLKRLSDARAAGDFIWAVIKGSAINNDGAAKPGFTAPSAEGQAEVIGDALDQARVSGRSIGYVEAHGTGTFLGDPIEISALTKVYRQSTMEKGFCAIGSLKTNIGHLDVAAGVAGLIKAALAVHHGRIPPSLHYRQPNPNLGIDQSPFYVNAALSRWPEHGEPRRAAVSAFGIGGTNAHVILEQAPARP